jgi:putative photosynthetic complex assembly protein 2
MASVALPVGFALFCWWFATGAIFYLDGLPRSTYRRSMLAATGLLLLAFVGLAVSSRDPTPTGAYLAFGCGILVWAWQEMSFLMGFLTGPRKHACAPGCRGWRHFLHGIHAILHHELALLAGGAVVLALTWGGNNQVGAWTYLALWVMRQSAKLNLFLGVRNLGESLLPEHLHYLKGYFRRRALNPLLPISVIASAGMAIFLAQLALQPGADAFVTTGLLLVATLLALAALEHLFLVLPMPLDALWEWGLKSRQRGEALRLDSHCNGAPVVAVKVEP